MIHIIDSKTLLGSYAPHICLTFEAPEARAAQLTEIVSCLTASPGRSMSTAAHPVEVESARREIERLLADAETRGRRYASGTMLLLAALEPVYGPALAGGAYADGALLGTDVPTAERLWGAAKGAA